MATQQSIYGDQDLRDIAAYTVAETARYLRIPTPTLRTWVAGRPSSPPLIAASEDDPPRLSFHNVIEAYTLRALRTRHGVSIGKARAAIKYAERKQGITRLLLRPELRTAVGELFLKKYGELINLNRSGQLAIEKLLKDHLKQIRYDDLNLPIQLFPSATAFQIIVLDPRVAFGRPVISRRGISTAAIVDRADAGETVEEIAADYDLSTEEVEAAIVYDQAA